MDTPTNSGLISSLKSFSQAASVMVVFAGCLVLACCFFNLAIPAARLDFLHINANSALAFILAGLALGLLSSRLNPRCAPNPKLVAVQRQIGVGCAVAVSLIGLLTLCDHFFGWNLSVQSFLFQGSPGAGTRSNMAPNIALNFLLIGSALLFLTVRVKSAQVLTLVAGCIALLAFVPALYGQKASSGIANYTNMAMATALAFVVLCAGLLCAGVDRGLTKVIARPTAGGVIARRLVPASFIVPIFVGWLVVEGWKRSCFDAELGLALFTILNVIVFASLLWCTARTSDRIDNERQEAERKYRDIVENAVEGIFQATLDGRYLTVNPAMARILGYISPEELMAQIPDLGEHVFADSTRRDEFIRVLQEHGVVVGFEFEAKKKNGEKIWLSGNARFVRSNNGSVPREYYEGTVADITMHRRLEEQFRQSQKMEAVGRLAGGVAHDFNNILTVILGHTELSLAALSSDMPSCRPLSEIDKAGKRASTLVRQLLAFSRKQTLLPEVLDLNAVISDFEKMLRRLIGEDICLITAPGAGLGRVKADPGQMEQVIMNLAVNARDAMPNGGKLVIKTANVELDEAYTRKHSEIAAGTYVMLAVSDTGCGMTADVQAHLFEPFFTTKAKGKGTGLGLATVYGIVKQSGGHINVYSEPGHGTTFKIYLPHVEATGQLVKRDTSPADLPQGWETVLLVEDDRDVRAMTRTMLDSLGYRVVEAASGGEAAVVMDTLQEPVHLLLTDVIMPGVKGPELAERLTAKHPAMKVLYMSGYTDEIIIPLGVLNGWPFLHKPFTRVALAQKIREVLDVPKRSRAPIEADQAGYQEVLVA